MQNAEQDILKEQDMLTELYSTVTGLQQCEQKFLAENKRVILVKVVHVNKLTQVSIGTPPNRHEKFTTLFSRHLVGLAVKMDKNLPSLVEREASKLHRLSEQNARFWTGGAEVILSQRARTDD